MGRRRRKRLVKRVKRIIPDIFNCPNCGTKTVIIVISKKDKTAEVTCGGCRISWNTKVKEYEEKVDVYNSFVDAFLDGEIVR